MTTSASSEKRQTPSKWLCLVVLTFSCLGNHPPLSTGSLAVAPLEPRCTRVSGSRIGQLPLEVKLGEQTVRLTEWTAGDAVSTAVVGFAAEFPAGVTFTVEAGDRTFAGDSPRWLNPLGVAGPRVHGIDALTFCAHGDVEPNVARAAPRRAHMMFTAMGR
jgi:hypothetical protein